jgi:GGDEF domain-containing protein
VTVHGPQKALDLPAGLDFTRRVPPRRQAARPRMMYSAHDCPYNTVTMNRRILIFYYIISLLFLLVLLAFAVWRFKATLDRNVGQAENAFADLKVSALSTYLAEGTFASEYFKYNLRQQASLLPRLQAVSVRSQASGIEYLWARNRLVLRVPDAPESGYRLEKARDRLLSAPFTGDYVLEGVFRVLEWEDLTPALRELFYMLLAFLVITAVALVAVSSAREPATGYVPLQPQRVAAAPRREGLVSSASGLGLREHLSSRLGHELERAASSDQDLTLLLLALEPRHAGAFGHLAHRVLNTFPYRDLCFEYDGRTCAVIMPDKDLAQGLKDARAFQRSLAEDAWPGGERVAAGMGLSARNGRLVDARRLLLEAAKALERAMTEGSGHIVAFQADPEKFRRTLAG